MFPDGWMEAHFGLWILMKPNPLEKRDPIDKPNLIPTQWNQGYIVYIVMFSVALLSCEKHFADFCSWVGLESTVAQIEALNDAKHHFWRSSWTD